MNKDQFEKVDPLVDDIAGRIIELIDGEAFDLIKQRLAELSREFPDFSVTLDMNVQVFDSENGHALRLLQTGLSSSDGAAPYQHWGDATPQRYVVYGDIVIVPHDHCPQCWGIWDFKDLHPQCPECGIRMGEQVKLLLDTDCCPSCEKGRVTANQPQCPECGFAVNPDHVVWG